MYFPQKKKNAGSSILDHWESSKYPKEMDEKPDFTEAPVSKMAEGGEVDPKKEADHKEACKEIAKDILDAIESKSPGVLASALSSLIEQCKMHEES